MSSIVPEDDLAFDDDLVIDDPFTTETIADDVGRPIAQIVIPATVRAEKSETDITKDSIRWLKDQPNTYAWKLFSGPMGESGHPDIDGCSDGRSIKIEMKRPGKRPTPQQMARLRQWRATGAIVGWATSVAHVAQLYAYSREHSDWRNPLTGPGIGVETP